MFLFAESDDPNNAKIWTQVFWLQIYCSFHYNLPSSWFHKRPNHMNMLGMKFHSGFFTLYWCPKHLENFHAGKIQNLIFMLLFAPTRAFFRTVCWVWPYGRFSSLLKGNVNSILGVAFREALWCLKCPSWSLERMQKAPS